MIIKPVNQQGNGKSKSRNWLNKLTVWINSCYFKMKTLHKKFVSVFETLNSCVLYRSFVLLISIFWLISGWDHLFWPPVHQPILFFESIEVIPATTKLSSIKVVKLTAFYKTSTYIILLKLLPLFYFKKDCTEERCRAKFGFDSLNEIKELELDYMELDYMHMKEEVLVLPGNSRWWLNCIWYRLTWLK